MTVTQRSTESSDGTTIAFDTRGDGPPLILVGGAFQHRAFDPRTERLAELLADTFTVVHYDRRGRGDSGDTPPYAVEREIEDLDALVRVMGGAAAVFGMSSGAVLAIKAAARGVGIARLALYEPPAIVDETRAPLPNDYVAHLDELIATGRRGDAVEYFMTTSVGLSAEMVAGMRDAPIWPGFEAVAHTLSYDGRIMEDVSTGDPSSLRPWASVEVPTLVVDGGASPPWLRSASDALARVLPRAERRTLDGQAHDVDPDVLAPLLKESVAG